MKWENSGNVKYWNSSERKSYILLLGTLLRYAFTKKFIPDDNNDNNDS